MIRIDRNNSRLNLWVKEKQTVSFVTVGRTSEYQFYGNGASTIAKAYAYPGGFYETYICKGMAPIKFNPGEDVHRVLEKHDCLQIPSWKRK